MKLVITRLDLASLGRGMDSTAEARTLRAIATWADNAADLYEEWTSEYDLASEFAVSARLQIIECMAEVFRLMVSAPQDLKWRIYRGMEGAVDDSVLPCGCARRFIHEGECPGDEEELPRPCRNHYQRQEDCIQCDML